MASVLDELKEPGIGKKPMVKKTMAGTMEEDVNPMEKDEGMDKMDMTKNPDMEDDDMGMKPMKIAVPKGVMKFDEAEPGDEVKVMCTVKKTDSNYGEIMSMDGKKMAMGDDDDGMDGDEENPNKKPGDEFLDQLDEMGRDDE